MSLSVTPFGTLPCGRAVDLFTLSNRHGLSAQISNYGGIVVSLKVPDRLGRFDDIVLGKDSLDGYVAGHPCFGSICGRVAGRIRGARFTLNSKTYRLAANDDGINNLHGGPEGYHLRLWQAASIQEDGLSKLQLKLIDPAGDNGFPGEVTCLVTYALRDDNTLEIQYEAVTDQSTPFNPTNHSYFNLRGSGDALGHTVQILADECEAAPGQRTPVTPGYNDYRAPVRLGSLKTLDTGNADTHFFFPGGETPTPKRIAVISDPDSGRTMEVHTTRPGVQFYAGLFLSKDAPEVGKGGIAHQPYDGLCFETQDYPDSINKPALGNAVLHPGETFRATTCFHFKC